MTSLAFMECCQRLSVDPKTLRQWLAQAEMSAHPHPKDARTTCLTLEQLQLLAALHGRVLHPAGMPLVSTGAPPDGASNADLLARLVQVETQVATLQTQLTDLALQLLKAREQRTEQRLQAFEAQIPTINDSPVVVCEPFRSVVARQASRKEKHLIPLIEYGADDRYVMMSPTNGELEITPDTSEWVAWLATLSSFRFIGKLGRFSTYRQAGRTYWTAYRRIHGQRYDYTLGRTEYVTIERLEHMAQTLQTHVPSL